MPLVLINPQIDLGAETEKGTEGCLSFPEITGEIVRAKSITVEAQNLDGEPIEIETTGFVARAVQHEVDQLDGLLFIDRMSTAGTTSLSSKLNSVQKETRSVAKDRQTAVA